MKRFLLLFAAMLACVSPVAAQTVTVSATNVHDIFGNKLASGQACFLPTDNSGDPMSYKDGSGGQVEGIRKCVSVTNGAFSATLSDTSLTNPANVCYQTTVKDTSNGTTPISSGYECVQPTASNYWCTSGACNFDNYTPTGTPNVVQVAGPLGPVGPAGPTGPPGTMSAASAIQNVIMASGYTNVQAAVNVTSATQVFMDRKASDYTDTAITVPSGVELTADRGAKFAGAGATITWNYPTTFVEQGVIYPFYKLGDVRRYGIFPDGTTNWEASFNGRMTAVYANSTVFQVNWPAGFYNTNMDLASAYSGSKMHFDEGAEFGGLIHLISSASPLTCIVGSSGATRATNVVTLTFSGACSFTVGAQIYVYDMADTTFNGGPFTVATVPDSTHMTYAQTAPDVAFSGYGHVNEPPLSNLSWTGTVTTYDRFGTINLVDSFVDRIHVKNDPTKHTNFPGAKARGVHIYYGTRNFRWNDITVDDTGNLNNTDACVSIDGFGDNPDSLTGERIYVKKCDTTAVYVTGPGHKFGEIEVDAWGAQSYNGSGVQDGDGLAQSQELKGVWLNRTWDDWIGRIFVGQATDSRPNAKYNVMIDETGIVTQNGAKQRGIAVDAIVTHNCAAQGCVSFTDRNFAAPNMHAHVGLIEAQTTAAFTAGYQAVSHNAPTTDDRLVVDAMRFDVGTNPAFLAASGTVNMLGTITTATGGAGRFAEMHGKMNVREIRNIYSGGTITSPLVELSGSGANDSVIDEVNLQSPSANSSPAMLVGSITNFSIGRVNISGFHNSSTGALQLDATSLGSINGLNLNCGAAAGFGLYLSTSITDVRFANGLITNCSIGVARLGGITYSNVLAQNIDVSSNTTQSQVAAGNIATQSAPGFTTTGNGMDVIGTLGATTANFGNAPLFTPTNPVAIFTGVNGANPNPIILGERVANEGAGVGFARGTDGTMFRAWGAKPSGTSGVFDLACGSVTGMFRTCAFDRAVSYTPKTVTFSATPTFSANDSSVQVITLTANVTSSTISGGIDGQLLTLRVCENATGGFTFAWPTSVNNPMSITTTASKCNVQSFQFNGATSKWDALTSGIAN